MHKDLLFLPPSERFTTGTIQTFFSPVPQHFFQVNPDLENLASDDMFLIYLRDQVPAFVPFPANPPITEREVPPFLQMTQWHLHLKDYLSNFKTRSAVKDLVKLPDHIPHKPAGIDRLRELSFGYLDKVRALAKNSHITVLCMLQEYPL